MTPIDPRRLTVRRDEPFVVFLIGMRVTRWWLVPIVWAAATAMGRMLRELVADPGSGLLAFESYGGRTTLMVQYWRSNEHLLRYAHRKDAQHVPAWRQWIQRWGHGALGIWHETYLIDPGAYECVYHHMPPFGLGKVGPLVPAEGPLKTAAGRLGRAERATA